MQFESQSVLECGSPLPLFARSGLDRIEIPSDLLRGISVLFRRSVQSDTKMGSAQHGQPSTLHLSSLKFPVRPAF